MALPRFQTDNKDFQLMQSAWASQLDPVLSNPSLKTRLLKDVALAVGANVINHKLGRTPQGWRIVDVNGAAQIYRSEALNPLTLTLTSDAVVTVSIEVF
jgi:hypothetical protein